MRYLIDAKALNAPQKRHRFVVENVILLNRPLLGSAWLSHDRANQTLFICHRRNDCLADHAFDPLGEANGLFLNGFTLQRRNPDIRVVPVVFAGRRSQ